MKFISFYTGQYQWDAEQLIKSMVKLGINNYEVDYLDSVGSWESNTQLKASFILEKLKQNDSVIWTDADSRIRQKPSFFSTITTDVGMFFLPKDKSDNFTLPKTSILQNVDEYLQSSTMYFKNNERVISLLESWIKINQKDTQQWDQWTLQVALQQSDVSITRLPPQYVWFDGNNSPIYAGTRPVIEHTQASRRFKDKNR